MNKFQCEYFHNCPYADEECENMKAAAIWECDVYKDNKYMEEKEDD